MIESLSLIDAVMPDVVASRQKEVDRQKKNDEPGNNNSEENREKNQNYCEEIELSCVDLKSAIDIDWCFKLQPTRTTKKDRAK